MHRYTKLARMLLPVACLLACLPARSLAQNPYQVDTIVVGGKEVAVYVFPGRPPANRAPEVRVPFMAPAAETNILASMPAFYWSYGCSPTAAAMMMGYYDLNGYPNLYTGPANGGVCPQTNSTWGFTQYRASCVENALSVPATRVWMDAPPPGHVDDYWVGSTTQGRSVLGMRPGGTRARLLRGLMGTASVPGNADGSTLLPSRRMARGWTIPGPNPRRMLRHEALCQLTGLHGE